MKKLTVIVKPANREDVIDIMESCAVYGVMETDITGYGNQKGYRVMYRGTMSGPNVLPGKEAVYRKYRRRKDFCRESGRCHPGSYRPAWRGSIIKTKDSKKVQRGSQNRSFSCLF